MHVVGNADVTDDRGTSCFRESVMSVGRTMARHIAETRNRHRGGESSRTETGGLGAGRDAESFCVRGWVRFVCDPSRWCSLMRGEHEWEYIM